jgi:replication initiation and membrane attachment protein
MGLQSSDFGLRPQDSFNVIRDFSINEQHFDILNRLFTPLVGPNAMGLYYYLEQFVTQKAEIVSTHYVVMSELQINLSEFRTQMDALEAIGLVKSYVHHDSNTSSFVYKLIQPPTAYKFFSDPMLSIFLFTAVGKERYHQLKAHFEATTALNLSDYQEITRKFTDVFSVPNKQFHNDVSNIKREKSYEGLNLAKVDFDFEALYDLLQSHFISTEIINADAKALITQLATLYGLTPEAMKSVILKSITSAQQLSFEDMRKYARTYYQMEHEQSLPSLQLKQQSRPQPEDNGQTTEEDRLEQLNRVSPIEMLTAWKGSEISLDEKKLVEELVEREQLPFGVINILLQFVMLKRDMRLPKKYTLTIAAHWKRKGLKTAQEAEPFAKKINEEEQQQKSHRSFKQPRANLVSKEMTPKWLLERDSTNNDQQNQPDNETTATNDSEHEQERAAFLQHLKERWGDDD